MTEHRLIAFLRARYCEREQRARAGWSPSVVIGEMEIEGGTVPVMGHAYDPAEMLADIASKRKILDAHHPMEPARGRGQDPLCAECSHGPDEYYTVDYPCLTVRLLAEPFASHPDYPSEGVSDV